MRISDWSSDVFSSDLSTGEQIDRDAFERRVMEDEEFARKWGDLGPVYGAQWVNWPRYELIEADLYRRKEKGHNQIAQLVETIRTNPGSRRLLFTGWNVDELDQMALPPCHMTYQFHVANGRSEEHTSELQSLMRISYAVFCLKKKKTKM